MYMCVYVYVYVYVYAYVYVYVYAYVYVYVYVLCCVVCWVREVSECWEAELLEKNKKPTLRMWGTQIETLIIK